VLSAVNGSSASFLRKSGVIVSREERANPPARFDSANVSWGLQPRLKSCNSYNCSAVKTFSTCPFA